MLTVTPNAHAQINEILLDEQEAKYVRAFISGGGCAGFNYGFTLENEKNEDDFEIEKLIIDADRKSTRLNSSHIPLSRMPSSA